MPGGVHRHGSGGLRAKRDRFGARRAELTKEAGGVELLDLASGSCRVILLRQLDILREVPTTRWTLVMTARRIATAVALRTLASL